MYYELYIDLFFLENFMMDSILLLFVRSVFGKKSFTIRTFTAGICLQELEIFKSGAVGLSYTMKQKNGIFVQ